VRLLVGIPLLAVSFVLHLRRSLRGTVLFIGSLASFFYHAEPGFECDAGCRHRLLHPR
jgi:hypothetical protein